MDRNTSSSSKKTKEIKIPISSALLRRLRQALLAWFQTHGRDLPWRKTNDPYPIWISEVMLQQTQVEQAIPYYIRFLESFPTIYDLARASLDDVLKVWQGMGYYTRARHLHETARRIVDEHQGIFPNTYTVARDLAGLGDYTAGAILSIAFNQPHTAVDGNVSRVLSRVFRIEGNPKQADVKRLIRRYAARLLPKDQPGQFNQALMELGALVCFPQHPQCLRCCWAKDCRAYRELPDPSVLPFHVAKKPRPHYQVASGIIWREDKVLIVRRPSKGLLANLWEFPTGTQTGDEPPDECCRHYIREELGIDLDVVAPFMTFDHGYSHFSITLHAFYSLCRGGTPAPKTYPEFRWVRVPELTSYAFAKASKVLVDRLQSQSQSGAQLDLFNPRWRP